MSGRLWSDEFRAMGTSCSVSVVAGASDVRRAYTALAAARSEVDACEHALSRFDRESDLSLLNRRAGEWVRVDARLVDALAAALRARELTDGHFDPTILPALAAAGYDRSFEQLRPRPARRLDGFRAGAAVEIDGERARVEAGAGVDLGGIGKGFSAMRALAAMRAAWPEASGAIVDLGGDIALDGSPPEGGRWRIGVADPHAPGRTLGVLSLERGGIATSGRDRRRFGVDRELHHLIDPATGAPAVEGPLTVTVVAPDAATAEAFATAFAILPLAETSASVAGRPWLAALVVRDEGAPTMLGPLVFEPAVSRKAAA